MKKAVKSVVKGSKPSIAVKPVVQNRKVFIAYDSDNGNILQSYHSMDAVRMAYWTSSMTNADMEWVVVETDVVNTSAIRNEIKVIDFKKYSRYVVRLSASKE